MLKLTRHLFTWDANADMADFYERALLNFDEVYPIPAALTQGKSAVTVRFQAHPQAWAGGVFGVRLLRKE